MVLCKVWRKIRITRFAYDFYHRFIQMFFDVVLEIPEHQFEYILSRQKEKQRVIFEQKLTVEALRTLFNEYKAHVKEQTGRPFLEDSMEQLFIAVEAVFRSWNNDRAIQYRNLSRINHDLGTAVNIQAMVFGNIGSDSGPMFLLAVTPLLVSMYYMVNI